MIFKLYKMSSPGFEKSFVTLQDLGAELEKYICSECTGTNAQGESSKMDVEGMLGTPCGCEFQIYDPITEGETELEWLERRKSGDYRISVHKAD